MSGGDPSDSADHFAGEALRVEVALGGDHEIGALDALVEFELVGYEIEAREESPSEGGESSRESSGGTRAGEVDDVDSVLLSVDVGESFEPAGE